MFSHTIVAVVKLESPLVAKNEEHIFRTINNKLKMSINEEKNTINLLIIDEDKERFKEELNYMINVNRHLKNKIKTIYTTQIDRNEYQRMV